jgi:hypothetical protein
MSWRTTANDSSKELDEVEFGLIDYILEDFFSGVRGVGAEFMMHECMSQGFMTSIYGTTWVFKNCKLNWFPNFNLTYFNQIIKVGV